MGITRESTHKRRSTGGKRKPHRKKRAYELGRPPAGTRIGPNRIHPLRVRGGHTKHRALRLETGNFSWGTEAVTRKTRLLSVVYNASNNELVRTNTLVKNAIIQIDATPFRQWYEQHYGIFLGKKKEGVARTTSTKTSTAKDTKKGSEKAKKGTEKAKKGTEKAKQADTKDETPKTETAEAPKEVVKSSKVKEKLAKRRKDHKLDVHLEEQFTAGRLYAAVASRPGQSGRCDGYLLEGEELAFYVKKLAAKKKGK